MDKYRSLGETIARYKGVVLDLDETLVNLNTDWKALKKTLSEFTKKQTGEEIEFTPLDQKIHQVKEKFGELFFFQLLELISQFELCEEKYELNYELISLLEFYEEKKIAIYSMNTRKCVENFVKKNLKRKPDTIVVKDNCSEPKPTEKDLQRIMQEWNMNESEIVYIGNSEGDRLSGEKAGVKTYIIQNFTSRACDP